MDADQLTVTARWTLEDRDGQLDRDLSGHYESSELEAAGRHAIARLEVALAVSNRADELVLELLESPVVVVQGERVIATVRLRGHHGVRRSGVLSLRVNTGDPRHMIPVLVVTHGVQVEASNRVVTRATPLELLVSIDRHLLWMPASWLVPLFAQANCAIQREAEQRGEQHHHQVQR